MRYLLSIHAQEQLLKPERNIPREVFEQVMINPEQVDLLHKMERPIYYEHLLTIVLSQSQSNRSILQAKSRNTGRNNESNLR